MKKVLLGIGMVFIFCSNIAVASDLENGRETLKGIAGVEVIVDTNTPDFEKLGLSIEQIKTNIEQRLRAAGIKVLTTKEKHSAPGSPYLLVHTDILKKDEFYSCGVLLALNQRVRLERDKKISAVGETWSAVCLFGRSDLVELQNRIIASVDIFINAWKSANPPK